jgi:SAM-dependent methyltransferase
MWPALSFEALKRRQRKNWSSVRWESLAAKLAVMHDHLVSRLDPRPGERWLDVATGTGAIALRAARAGAQVTAVDLAPGLIATARDLAAEQRLSIRFDIGDAENLPYEDARFDVVASALGVFLAPSHDTVAREVARVCRPGGRLGVVAWRPDPGLDEMKAPFRPPRPPGAGDPANWGREEYVSGLLGAGFELAFEEDEVAITARSGEEMWRLYTSSDGAHKATLESLDPKRKEAFRRAFVDHYERYRAGDGIRAPRNYLLTLGRRRGA